MCSTPSGIKDQFSAASIRKPYSRRVLNAFRHQRSIQYPRLVASWLMTVASAQRLPASKINSDRANWDTNVNYTGAQRLPASKINSALDFFKIKVFVSCAQRLPASKINSGMQCGKIGNPEGVLNAFRHQRSIQGLEGPRGSRT